MSETDRSAARTATAPRLAGRAPRFNILTVASEVWPWAKTGGLADVLGALPAALDDLGHTVTTVLPRYGGLALDGARVTNQRLVVGAMSFDTAFHVLTQSPRRRVVFLDIPALFERAGLYGANGRDFPDNAVRFGALCRAALEFAQHDSGTPTVDIVHGHDWQAGLLPALLRSEPTRYPKLAHAATVCTIHNVAYQGIFPKEVVPELGLPWDVFAVERGEFWGRFSFLKAAITDADMVTTVSPAYARETQTPVFGRGMEGVLRARTDRYVGILNGVDTKLWDPRTDPNLAAHYDADALAGKRVCKRALLELFGFSVGDDAMARPVVALVARLVDGKGLDLIAEAADALMALDATWVFVGSGETRHEQFLSGLAARWPSRVAVRLGFDDHLAHMVEAGADLFLMPSTFEPCGLNQMYSQRYGTVPIVHGVGGLDDTVQPYTIRARHANGFKFRGASADAMVKTVKQALRLYHDTPAWQQLMRRAMETDHSWETPAREYVKVYRRAQHSAAIRTMV